MACIKNYDESHRLGRELENTKIVFFILLGVQDGFDELHNLQFPTIGNVYKKRIFFHRFYKMSRRFPSHNITTETTTNATATLMITCCRM